MPAAPETVKKNSRFHVAHVTFDMRIGGAERVISTLVRNTDPALFRVSVLCLDRHRGPFGEALSGEGVLVENLDRKPGFDISLIGKIRRFVKRCHVNVLHCHQYTPFVYGALASPLSGAGVIFTEHGRFFPDCRRPKRVLVNPLLNALCASTTAISKATKVALVENENLPANRISVIYNGIEDIQDQYDASRELKAELGVAPQEFVLGTVARMDENKNQAMMVRALHQVIRHHPETVLVIVGDGPERGNVEALTDKLGLNDRVRFTGFRQDACRLYSIFDVFMLTSHTEGTAMTLLEAMSAGLPCIATDVGGNPEIVLHQESGFLVEDDNDRQLAETIMRISADRKLLQRMGAKARQRFETCFSVDKMVTEYQHLYHRILGVADPMETAP